MFINYLLIYYYFRKYANEFTVVHEDNWTVRKEERLA